MMQPTDTEPTVIGLREFVGVIRRRRRSVYVVAVLTAVVALTVVAFRAPVYTSRAQVEVRPLTVDEQLQPFAADSFVNMETEAARVTQEPVAALAAPDLGLDPDSPADLVAAAKNVRASVQPSTTFLDITCTRSDVTQARDCAAAFASAYVTDRIGGARDLYDERTQAELNRIDEARDQIVSLREQLGEPGAERASILAEIDEQNRLITAAQSSLLSLPTASPDAAVLARSAELPSGPSNKNYLLIGGLAVLLGLALGIGLALIRERLVEPVADRDRMEGLLHAPVLAAVSDPTPRMGSAGTLVTVDAPDGPAAHAYLAAAAMLREEADGHHQVIAVTGPGKEDGKTTTTANLGVALSTGGSRVAVLSGDLREPRLHELFDRGNEIGLTTLMTDGSGVADILQLTEVDELILIASGPPVENPTEFLGGERMRKLLDVLRTGFDFILLDTGPGLVMADVLLLAPVVDGFVVVADAAKTSREDVSHLRTRLEGAGGKVIGGVLTGVELQHARRDLSTLPEAMWERARQRTESRAARVDGARDTEAPAAAPTPTPRSPARGKSDQGTHPSASSKRVTDPKGEPVAAPEAVRSGTSSSIPTPSKSKSARSTTTKSTKPAAAPKPKSARSSGSSPSRGSKTSSSGSTPKARAGRPSTTDAPDEDAARGEAPDRGVEGTTPEGGPTRAPAPPLEEATGVPPTAPEIPSPSGPPTDSEDPVDVRAAPPAPDDGHAGATDGPRNDDETEPDGPPGGSDGNGQVRRSVPATPADEPPRGGR